jgi:hypothetical protein
MQIRVSTLFKRRRHNKGGIVKAHGMRLQFEIKHLLAGCTPDNRFPLVKVKRTRYSRQSGSHGESGLKEIPIMQTVVSP